MPLTCGTLSTAPLGTDPLPDSGALLAKLQHKTLLSVWFLSSCISKTGHDLFDAFLMLNVSASFKEPQFQQNSDSKQHILKVQVVVWKEKSL